VTGITKLFSKLQSRSTVTNWSLTDLMVSE
jgi:hypothetical protein